MSKSLCLRFCLRTLPVSSLLFVAACGASGNTVAEEEDAQTLTNTSEDSMFEAGGAKLTIPTGAIPDVAGEVSFRFASKNGPAGYTDAQGAPIFSCSPSLSFAKPLQFDLPCEAGKSGKVVSWAEGAETSSPSVIVAQAACGDDGRVRFDHDACGAFQWSRSEETQVAANFCERNWATLGDLTSLLNADEKLVDFWPVADDNIFVVSEQGRIFRYDGSVWQVMPHPETSHLSAVWGRNANDVYAAGSAILHFDGSTWVQVNALPADEPATHVFGDTSYTYVLQEFMQTGSATTDQDTHFHVREAGSSVAFADRGFLTDGFVTAVVSEGPGIFHYTTAVRSNIRTITYLSRYDLNQMNPQDRVTSTTVLGGSAARPALGVESTDYQVSTMQSLPDDTLLLSWILRTESFFGEPVRLAANADGFAYVASSPAQGPSFSELGDIVRADEAAIQGPVYAAWGLSRSQFMGSGFCYEQSVIEVAEATRAARKMRSLGADQLYALTPTALLGD